jgi:hypothetical protein
VTHSKTADAKRRNELDGLTRQRKTANLTMKEGLLAPGQTTFMEISLFAPLEIRGAILLPIFKTLSTCQ